ncbi:hypothetical protein G6F56_011003 [Rhizopus delemar]|nr:hypothetical protein G6F56_011003 [Rhizopus delemar]
MTNILTLVKRTKVYEFYQEPWSEPIIPEPPNGEPDNEQDTQNDHHEDSTQRESTGQENIEQQENNGHQEITEQQENIPQGSFPIGDTESEFEREIMELHQTRINSAPGDAMFASRISDQSQYVSMYSYDSFNQSMDVDIHSLISSFHHPKKRPLSRLIHFLKKKSKRTFVKIFFPFNKTLQ